MIKGLRQQFVQYIAGAIAVVGVVTAFPLSVSAKDCGDTAAGFSDWLKRFKKRAVADGISARAVNRGLAGVSYDRRIIKLDRNQHYFKVPFKVFYNRRVGPYITRKGLRLLKRHRRTIQRIEQKYGVPGEFLVAIWGLETNYGRDGGGKRYIPRSLATLAYDCRRSEFFTNELFDVLRIIDRGDMKRSQLVGGWAGEIGAVQFLPSGYYKHATDFDGDGRIDLFNSAGDILASLASFFKGHGWRTGEPWGPGTHNYEVINDWNRATVYRKTIAMFAETLGRGK